MKKHAISAAVSPAVMLFVSVAVAAVFHSYRSIWVFYDPFLKWIGGAAGIFVLQLLIVLFWLFALAACSFRLRVRGGPVSEIKAFRIAVRVAFALTLLFVLAVIGIIFIAGSETNRAMLLYLKRELPFAVLFLGAAALVLLPLLRGKGRAALCVCLSLLLTVPLFLRVFPLCRYRILADPLVLDTGGGYSVVFATNSTGTAFVKYTYAGEDYTVYQQSQGRRIADRCLHSVPVPYEHLKNNTYTVGSTRVAEEYAYGSLSGKTVESKAYTLQVNESAHQTYLTVSDWHTHTKDAKTAASVLGYYDGVILLGDAASGMEFEEQAVKYIAVFGGELTRGEMPAFYVRGNHETRGAFAAKLPAYLGLNSFYYEAERGPYRFIVLDSSEDKPDNHVEYGGLDQFSAARGEMAAWVGSLSVSDKKTVVLSHAWQVSEPDEELSAKFWDSFARLGVRFVISGHEHTCRFVGENNEEEAAFMERYPKISAYIDGGHSGKNTVVSCLEFKPEGDVLFRAVDQNREFRMFQTLLW